MSNTEPATNHFRTVYVCTICGEEVEILLDSDECMACEYHPYADIDSVLVADEVQS